MAIPPTITCCEPRAGAAPALRRRGRRVTVLVAGVVVLSVADLVVTLAHLRTVGMLEANPIAEYLIRTTRSPWALAGYKAFTVGVCVALLYRLRRHTAGEVAAWCALGILAAMSVLWHVYSIELESPQAVRMAQWDHGEEWLFLD